MDEQQLALDDLLPPERLEFVEYLAPLRLLPADADLVGPPPSRELVESVRRLGVLQPVLLYRPDPDSPYVVAAGRRRIKAARLVGLETVPARVYEQDGALTSLLSLVENEQRRPNPAAALDAISDLARRGASESVIAKATGMPVGTIRKVLRLEGLHPALRTALVAGKVSASVAEAAVRLPGPAQAKLVLRLAEAGKLTLADVRAAQRVGATAALATLPDDLFSPAAPQQTPLALVEERARTEWRAYRQGRQEGRGGAWAYGYALRVLLGLRRELRGRKPRGH